MLPGENRIICMMTQHMFPWLDQVLRMQILLLQTLAAADAELDHLDHDLPEV